MLRTTTSVATRAIRPVQVSVVARRNYADDKFSQKGHVEEEQYIRKKEAEEIKHLREELAKKTKEIDDLKAKATKK